MSDVKGRGRRCSRRDKSFALTLFHKSPKIYKLLRKVFFLPSVTTLRRSLKGFKLNPGFNKNLFKALQLKTCQMSATDKLCVILFDEMSIKESLSYDIAEDSDPPHLIKNVRNNLKKHGLQVHGHDVKWKYIEELFNLDVTFPIRMAPKLTSKHIELPPFSSMRVKLATQVLSHSVAAGISTLSILGRLPPDAIHTGSFIERFDQLFNAFNSSSTSSPQKMRYAMSATSEHLSFLQDCAQWFKGVKSNGPRTRLPCLQGWEMSIQSLLCLWEELRQYQNVKFLLTGRLNQDSLENLFSVIRGKGGHIGVWERFV